MRLIVVVFALLACAPLPVTSSADAAPEAADATAMPADASAQGDADAVADDGPVSPTDAVADARAACPDHAERIGAACRCVTGYTLCGDHCVDLFNDGANCGACAALCEGGICALGRCVAVTPPVDAGRDAGDAAACVSMTPGNCCGVACPMHPSASAATCEAGRCGFVCAAIEGVAVYGNCDGVAANGCEVDLRTSAAHCGACGAACAAGRVCVARSCVCPALRGDCDGDPSNGCELDIGTSDLNCGACGRVCGAGIRCIAGSCVR